MDEIRVKIEWEGKTFEFQGSPEQIVVEIEKFVSKFIPTLSLAKKLSLSIDLRELAEMLSSVIKIKDNEIFLTEEASRLSQSDRILSVLAAKKLLHLMGMTETDLLSLQEIANMTIASSKSTSSRLSELYAQRSVDKIRSGNKVLYRITLNGILLLRKRLRKLASK